MITSDVTERKVRPPHKRLSDFLKNNRISVQEAGRQLQTSHVAILDWRRNRKTPSPPYRLAIAKWTGAHETPAREGSIHESEWESAKERDIVDRVNPFVAPTTEAA